MLMKNKIYNYQRQFPNKKLTQEEIDWCYKYQYLSFDAPIMYSEDVVDEKTFFDMVDKNIVHLEECLKDTISSINNFTKKMDSYKRTKM